MNIHTELKKAGVELDSHESDLYAKVTDSSKKIISNYKYKAIVTTFVSQIDNELWYDIPFAYNEEV